MGSKSEYEPRLDRKASKKDVEDTSNGRKSTDIPEKVTRKRAKENNETSRSVKTPDKAYHTVANKSSDSLKEYNEYLSEQVTKRPGRNEKEKRERNPLSPKNSYGHKNQKAFNENDVLDSLLMESFDDKKNYVTAKTQKSSEVETSHKTKYESKRLGAQTSKTEFDLDGGYTKARTDKLSESRKSLNNIREYGVDASLKRSKTQDRRKSPDGISRSDSPRTKGGSVERTKSRDADEMTQTSPKKTKGTESGGKYSTSPRYSETLKSSYSHKSRKKLYEFGASADMDDDDDDILESSTKSQSSAQGKEENENRKSKSRKSSNNLTKSRSLESPEPFENKDQRKSRESTKLERDEGILGARSSKFLLKSPSDEGRLNQKTKSSEIISDDDEERTDRKKVSKSPVYFAELNKLLSEKQQTKSRSSENIIPVEKEGGDNKAFLAQFEGLLAGKDREKDMEKEKEKNERSHIMDDKHKNKYESKNIDNSKDSDNKKEKGANKIKDKSLDEKGKPIKKENKKKKYSSSSSSSSIGDSERRTYSGSDDEKSKKRDIDTKPTTLSELMTSKKNASQLSEKLDVKDRIAVPKESKGFPPKKKSIEINEKLQSVDGASEIVDDIFKENVPKKKTLQRQVHVSVNEMSENEAERKKEDDKKKREVKDDLDTPFSKLNGASSCDELTTVQKEKTNLSKGRSLSANNISNFSSSPKKDKSLDKSSPRKLTSSRNDITYTVPTNSNDLKEIIYHQWLEKKKVQTKDEIKAKMLARKKAAQHAEAEANERKATAQKIYDAWNDSKTGKILTEKEIKQKAKQAEKEKTEETLQRKKDAEKYFETWKREKDEKIKKMHLQKKKEEKQKDKQSFQMKRQTSEEALKAFETWKIQKAKEIAEMKKKEDDEKAKVGEEKLLAFEKKQEALRVYEEWKSNSKKSPRAKSPQLIQRSWLPAGRNLNNTIPEQVQPVIIRNRNVSR